jgi:hypothetical protein
MKALDGRMGTIEAEQASMRTELVNISDRVGTLTIAVERLAGEVHAAGRTDWKLVVSVGGFVVLLGGLWLQPTREDTHANRRAIEALQERQHGVDVDRYTADDHDRYAAAVTMQLQDLDKRVTDHAMQAGHPQLVERVEALQAEVDLLRATAAEGRQDMDEMLQREMRLLDEALQREMRMLMDAPLERLRHLEEGLTTLERRDP